MQTMLEPGDASAPVGSRPWCIALHREACARKRDAAFALSSLKYALLSLRDKEYFRRLADRQGENFRRWQDFVQAPEPFGMGLGVDVAAAIMADPGNGLDMIRPSYKGGAAAAYLAIRIKREAPAIAASMDRYDSLQAGAIAAGIIAPSTVPLDVLRAAWHRADAAEQACFLNEIGAAASGMQTAHAKMSTDVSLELDARDPTHYEMNAPSTPRSEP